MLDKTAAVLAFERPDSEDVLLTSRNVRRDSENVSKTSSNAKNQ